MQKNLRAHSAYVSIGAVPPTPPPRCIPFPHMNTHSPVRICAFAAFASFASSASAAFVPFDTFDSYALSGLSGQGPAGNTWTAQAGTTVFDAGAGDKRATLTGPSAIPNYRLLTPASLSISNSNTAATVYWNFTISSAVTGNNWNFVVTDVPTPGDTAGSSEVQFNYDGGNAPAFRARNAAAFENLSLDGTVAGRLAPLAGILYSVWFEINNSTDTYQVFLQSDGDPLLATRRIMFAEDGSGSTFGFRNGAAANDLTTVNVGNGGTGNIVTFDDIYVDTAGLNSANPSVVPEPTVGALLGALGLAVALRRRRS
jgi:hypothetical protein